MWKDISELMEIFIKKHIYGELPGEIHEEMS